MKVKMFDIGSKYKIDLNGNIYGPDGIVEIKKNNKGAKRVYIYQKYVSYARIVATYLVPNPNNYDDLIFKDRNNDNCHPSNIEWVSFDDYHKYLTKPKLKLVNVEDVINTVKCPIVKEYYNTNNIDLINSHFIKVSNTITHKIYPYIMGSIYLKMISQLERRKLIIELDRFIYGNFHFAIKDMIRDESKT